MINYERYDINQTIAAMTNVYKLCYPAGRVFGLLLNETGGSIENTYRQILDGSINSPSSVIKLYQSCQAVSGTPTAVQPQLSA